MRTSFLMIMCALLVCAMPAAAQRRAGAVTPARPASSTQPAKRASRAPAPPPPNGNAAKPATTPARATTPAAKADDCGCESETPPDVLAVVNGTKISSKEIDDQISTQVQQLQRQVVEARKRELDMQINSMLLEAEARKRGTTPTKIIEQEIIARVPEPTEAEARSFYDQNRARLNGEWSAEIKDQIVQYLRDQRQQGRSKQFTDGLRAAAQVKMLAPEVTPPATAAARLRIFATVNGTPITSAMIEDSLKPKVFNAQQQIYNLRKQQLELRINDLLLAREAAKRQVTTQALFDAEITAKTKPVTDADARAFYEQNKARINGDFAQLKDQIIQFMKEQQAQNLSSSFAEQLRKGSSVQTFLREPAAPIYQIGTDDQPSRGAATAPVTIIEFTDFECSHCAEMQPVIERVVTEFGDRVRLVVRDFPLGQHTHAPKAAEAAEAARAQGKYWEYSQLLFANQGALEVPQLKEYASRIGLDRKKFDAMLDSGQFAENVQRDLRDGTRVGVNSTPSFFINGRPLQERSYDALKASIEAALKEKGRG